MVADWNDYVDDSNLPLSSILISERSRKLLLFALSHIDKWYDWLGATRDNDLFDEISGQIGNTYNEVMLDIMSDPLPIGTILLFPVQSPPSSKWLCCNGTYISQSTYSELYALIGEKFGVNNGSNFKLPNLVQRFPYGGNSSGADVIGFTGGTETETLALSQIPSHDHTIAHNHTIPIADGSGVQARSGRGTSTNVGTLATSASSAANSGLSGGGGPHNNLPPYLTLLFMIKALP